jgi:hypothetical protein
MKIYFLENKSLLRSSLSPFDKTCAESLLGSRRPTSSKLSAKHKIEFKKIKYKKYNI